MLLNEEYRGVEVWNRTKTVRNREKARAEQRPRPESKWVRVEISDLRIVSDELWQAVREQNRRVRDKHGPKRLDGMNRTEKSRTYLFSGMMECGLCGRNVTIIGGRRPNARYSCPSHRFRGVCKNAVTIPQRRLEQQLISALSANLLEPKLEEERAHEFSKQLKATLEREVLWHTRRCRSNRN
jgi:site-specific DNA recombinase